MKMKIPHLILAGLFGTAIASHAATVEWSLAANGDWDTTTSNWNANTATYTDGDAVQFNDSATGETLVQIAIPGGTVSPASVNFTDGGAGTTQYRFTSGSINGATSVTLDAGFDGTARFNVANAYTGGTTLNSGRLMAGDANALGTGTLTLNGGTFTHVNGANRTIANDIVISGTTTVLPSNTDLALSGAISGGGTLITGSQPGAEYLSFQNDLSGFTGKIIHTNSNQNYILFNGAGSVNTTAAIETHGQTSGGRYFRLQKNATFGELSGTGGNIGSHRNLTINQSTDTTYSGYMFVSQSGTFSFTKDGIGSLALNGALQHTYNGATTVSGGTLQLGDGGSDGAISTGSAISIGAGATFAINQSDTVTQGTDFSGAAITGDGGFTQSGTGTTVLNAANAYTGTTTISAGTLSLATGSSHSGAGAYTVNGGTLKIADGVNISTHAMTIDLGGVISPGNSPGTAITGDQTWNDGGAYLWEINNMAGGKGVDSGWDWLDIQGTLDINATFDILITSLDLSNNSGLADGFDTTGLSYLDAYASFIIATATGGVTGFDASAFNLIDSSFLNPKVGWSIENIGNDIVLNAFFVPEPSSTALLGLGLSSLLLRRRRS